MGGTRRPPWRSRIAATTLRAVLAGLGWTLVGASRFHPRVRAQITRSLVFEISTEDGVARHWSFDGPSRRTGSAPGRSARADHALRFTDSARALAALLSPDAVDRIIDELHRGQLRIEGSTGVAVWFAALGRTVLPLGSASGPRGVLPGAYLAPDQATRGDEHIVVEPAVSELDPAWRAAWRARATLPIVRATTGEPVPEA